MRPKVAMVAIYIAFLSLINTTHAKAQIRAAPNIDSFIEATVYYHFAEWTKTAPDHIYLINKNSLNSGIRTSYCSFQIKIEPEYEIFNLIAKQKGRRGFYWNTAIRWLGNDTCDVDILGKSVYVRAGIPFIRKRHIYVSIPCGGTDGYIPTARFVYDDISNQWTMYYREEILEAKRKQYKSEFETLREKAKEKR